jgi:hypothetical protein
MTDRPPNSTDKNRIKGKYVRNHTPMFSAGWAPAALVKARGGVYARVRPARSPGFMMLLKIRFPLSAALIWLALPFVGCGGDPAPTREWTPADHGQPQVDPTEGQNRAVSA